MNITLKPIDESNFLDAFHLQLRDDQTQYVSHPIRSLAQAYVYRNQCQPFGIYADARMVGYVMVIYDYDVPEYDIWHMMIDAAEQGKGYGTAAMKAVLDYIATKPFGDSGRVVLTCHQENILAMHLYESLGFAHTGNVDDGEEERESVELTSEQIPVGGAGKLKKHSGASFTMEDIIAVDEKMKNARDYIPVVAACDLPVMIYGETGTGKEVFAQSIHNASERRDKPFIAQNCAALPDTLLESILFGTSKGAFTGAMENKGLFELADGGTLFLDEIGNLPLGLQAKLLAALQNREVTRLGSNRKIPVDIRLIAATNRNLPEMVAQSLFREDLFYRINTIQIEIPPLRNRREDIALFVDYFLKKYTDLYGRPGLILHPQALEKLANYDWPGNIRELQHTIEKAVILAEKNVIRASDLFIRPGKALSFSEVPNLEEVERQAILAAITQNEGNLTAAAEQLGVSRQTLYNKMKRFNL